MTHSSRAPVSTTELAAAYQAAARREAQRVGQGAAIVGYKVGFTNKSTWELLGATEPMWGAMYDDTVVHLGQTDARFALSRFTGPRIEPEIVLHFSRAPADGASLEQVLECVDWIAQGYEIVVSRHDGAPATVAQAIENGGMHGALLVGEGRSVAALGPDLVARLERLQLSLHCDGELKETGTGSLVLGNPLNSVLHLVKGLAHAGRPPLKAGDTVTTGTLTAAYPIAAGQRWSTRISGLDLPDLEVGFE